MNDGSTMRQLRLQTDYKRRVDRIHAMYVDKLGGDFYHRFASERRREQSRLQREIDRHQHADEPLIDEGVQIPEPARNAQKLFERQEPREKRRLLNFVLSNCVWEEGEVRATFRQPFDLLAQTTMTAGRAGVSIGAIPSKHPAWLAETESNRRPIITNDASRVDPAQLPQHPMPRRFARSWRRARLQAHTRS